MKPFAFIVTMLLTVLVFFSISSATSEYARRTGFQCKACHIDTTGGGPLTPAGEKFLEELKLKGGYRPLSGTQRVVRFFIGYIHLITAIAWFGTILYVHILLKPAYASKGLPKGELLMGWIGMTVLLVTGVLLTISRVPSWRMLYTTRFGILLSIKIFLFLIMFLSALVVTVFIGPRLRRKIHASGARDSNYSMDELAPFDGKEGMPAHIAYKGIIYDVTGSRLWKNGSHMVKHQAGQDLTNALKLAPHGEEKLSGFPQAGKIRPGGEPERPVHERLFYFFAYMNLCLVFLITFIIAMWRWEF